MNSAELLEYARTELKCSYYHIGKLLRFHQENRIYDIRMGRQQFPEDKAIELCNLLNIDPARVLAAIKAERTKDPDKKEIWKRIAETMSKTAAALILAVLVTIAPQRTEAYAAPGGNDNCILCKIPHILIFSTLLQLIFAILAALS